MTTEVEPRRARAARANWGRWVVDCATSWCTNAWMPELGEPEWNCNLCGVPTEITWPPDPIAIEAILLMRPDVNSRNWEPPETLDDLVIQNAQHNIFPPGVDLTDPAGFELLHNVNGRVVGGLVFGPVEAWREIRTTNPSITAADEPLAYREIGA